MAREELGLSRTDMARLLGVSVATYVGWERGLAQASELEAALIKGFSAKQIKPIREPAEIKKVRQTLGLIQKDMAAAIGVHPITVARWELGTRRIGRRHGLLLATLLQEKTRS